jgi:predicted dehydrogenase/NADPH:quinone reductase-like Zn-dependent oxidoreductase
VTGYSLAGTILEVGAAVADLVPGQAVACAGASSAHHAEIVAVPRNLVVPVPTGLALEKAAAVTLGAIALQGVRQADLRLGETAFVLGFGLLGQITAALLRASGCRVLGSDVSPTRVEHARSLGVERALLVGRDEIEKAVDHATAGHGVDAVLLTASAGSSEPVRQAFRLVRRKGRVVIVGAVGLDLERTAFYLKEAELRISCSYGPGRYDPLYEEGGIDYPYGYVRWTENRNMQEFLRLMAEGSLGLDAVFERVYPVDEAPEAYRALVSPPVEERPLGVLLRYPAAEQLSTAPAPIRRDIEVVPRARAPEGLGVAIVGPGSFASEVHAPNLAALSPAVDLRVVVARTANAAREAARRWGALRAATDIEEALEDGDVHVVLICTRHDLHAGQAARALESGKAVFLEKPAALTFEELDRLEKALAASPGPFVVGFNRRFAPDVLALKSLLAGRTGPLYVTYRVNAGRLPVGHWALGPQGGGRLVGEACHMVDLMGHLVGRRRIDHRLSVLIPPAGKTDLFLGDNFALSCRYEDGSIASLVYTSLGHASAGKERIEAHWDGISAAITDFRGLKVHGVQGTDMTRAEADKGHRELLRRFIEHAAGRGTAPIALGDILDTSRFVLELDRESRGSPAPTGQP